MLMLLVSAGLCTASFSSTAHDFLLQTQTSLHYAEKILSVLVTRKM